MNLLPPSLAVNLSQGSYQVVNPRAGQMESRDLGMLLGCDPGFLVSGKDRSESRLGSAKSGALPGGVNALPRAANVMTSGFSPLSLATRGKSFSDFSDGVDRNFGYVAIGNPSYRGGLWDRHMVIVTRGTLEPKFTSNDWISNYNIGLQPGPNGLLVHAGFNRIWSGFQDFVLAAVKLHNPDHIHCVGHSLGGALASMNAELLSGMGRSVALYTFGAPRVGTIGFAQSMTSALQGRIKRVYHPADPVPMIPLLPFLHAPLSSGIRLSVPAGALVDGDTHLMASYVALVGDQEWGQLEAANTMLGDFQIDRWLKDSASMNRGFLMRSATLLEMIAKGLGRLIVKAIALGILSGLSAGITSTLTALDFISWLLARAAEIHNAIRDEIVGLVKAIFGFLGRALTVTIELTAKMLRWVLDLLFDFLAGVARGAVDKLGL